MKTILFLLQKGQFSAAVNNKVCNVKGGKSMAFEAYKIEDIVEAFEKGNVFLKLGSCWNDTKLFILYDSESAKYLFKIIEGFDLKNKVESCENFSFQIKLEEKSIYLKGDVSSFVKYVEQGDVAALAEIDQLKEEINNLKNEIKEKEETIKEINDTIKKLESANSEKDKTISKLNKEVEKQKELLKEMQSNLDPYSKLNFIDKGDYIELRRPIGNIRMIQKGFAEDKTWYEAMDYAKELRLGDFDDWRVPTKEELEEIYKIKDACGIEPGGSLWSSSTIVGYTIAAHIVSFNNGDVYVYGNRKYISDYGVRCVR